MRHSPSHHRDKFLTTFCLFLLALLSMPAVASDVGHTKEAKLKQAINGDHRSAKNSARDQYRKPLGTLSWLGLKDDMTVVEITPGGGWYTEILAPYLRENGTFYAAGFDASSIISFFSNNAKAFNEKLAANPAIYDKVIITELAPPSKTRIAPPGSVDMILTFRNVHNWMDANNSDAMLGAMYTALKPGGILGLVEHRGNPDIAQDPKAKSGYVNEAYVIALAEKAGFKLVEKSELLANSKDTKDHPKGVWTLPPTLRLKNKDRQKYLAIGESDRMLLKFIK